MGVVAWVLLARAAGRGAGGGVGVAAGNRRLEYVCKPATMVALVGVAATIQPATAAQQRWWLLALALGLCGDVLLMLPQDGFVAGLGAFLLGHIAYIAGFQAAGVPATAVGLWLAPLLLVLLGVLPRAIRGVIKAGRGTLVAPVVVYALVISVMAASALASGSRLAAAGGLLFPRGGGAIGHRRVGGGGRGV